MAENVQSADSDETAQNDKSVNTGALKPIVVDVVAEINVAVDALVHQGPIVP